MADNTVLNPGSGGDTYASDDIGGVKFQRIKLILGADGTNDGDVSKANPVPTFSTGKATYRATTAALLIPAVTVNVPWLVLYGSASKTVKPQRIILSGLTLTAVAYLNIGLAKYSSAPSGGTAVTFTKVPLDAADAAATANLVQGYTAIPTTGTRIGFISARRNLGQATTAAAAGIPENIEFDFRSVGESDAVTLSGTGQGIGLEWITAPATTVSLLATIEWTEE